MVNFYKVSIGLTCRVCRAPATYEIVGDGETYTRTCDKHADQEVDRLTKAKNERPD